MKLASRPCALIATLALAMLAAGCTTPYSRVDGDRYFLTNLDTYPVIVTRIDGESTPLHGPALIEPGRHEVTVRAFPTRYQHFGEERTITLDVAPCTRYWLVAVKPGPLSADFTVRVDYQEAISGCIPPGA